MNDDSKDSDSERAEEETTGYQDRFGFTITDSHHKAREISSKEASARVAKEGERAQKWGRMMKKWNAVTAFRQPKLKRRVRKGIPEVARGFAWYRLANGDDMKKKYPDLSKLPLDTLEPSVIDEIDRDVDRTFPRHIMFSTKEGAGQQSLRRILQCYAAVDHEIGYCQGMGFIAGLLLSYMVEEEAFYCFLSSLNNPQYNLRELYLPSMAGAKQFLYVFGELGRMHLGALWLHLVEQGIHPSMYVTEWIMTMFCRGFSFDLATRVWEIFLNEGFKIVYRVCLALLKNIEDQLRAADFEEIMRLIRIIPETVDAPVLLELAWGIPLRRAEIEELTRRHKETIVE